MLALVLPSFARFCIAMKFGIAIAARMPMITTTIISSMRVKPFCDLSIAISSHLSHSDRRSASWTRTLATEATQPPCHVGLTPDSGCNSLPYNTFYCFRGLGAFPQPFRGPCKFLPPPCESCGPHGGPHDDEARATPRARRLPG